ncbi:aminoglycoside adenylyltransferase [Ruegeria sp. ANG-S4]|uniref:GNAT family N-acetyltransferase n=1 Tax=Ruegeria sp. ANG-S4 TaxID=1577904 RepID=UPI00057DB877|nr:GNAT family N-acetyltransferase [Ruegeria sp. ANG-S4]KIC45816.1 aminoglycoside adenylyltransferase [Ruegeria sp. ANG-S4]
MTDSHRYSFKKVSSADLEILADWQSRPHVREWWDSNEPSTDIELADQRVERWIVSIEGRAFAYMQDYTVHGWNDHHFYDLPAGSRGIDQFIGDPDMLGRGHGPAFISERLQVLFAEGAPVVATDPHPDNARAIAAYRKAGFREFGKIRMTPWGQIRPMKINRTSKV